MANTTSNELEQIKKKKAVFKVFSIIFGIFTGLAGIYYTLALILILWFSVKAFISIYSFCNPFTTNFPFPNQGQTSFSTLFDDNFDKSNKPGVTKNTPSRTAPRAPQATDTEDSAKYYFVDGSMVHLYTRDGDKYYYSIVGVYGWNDDYTEENISYVVIKEYNRLPEVDYFYPDYDAILNNAFSSPVVEGVESSANFYLYGEGKCYTITKELPVEDFSDLITDYTIATHPEIFDDRTDYSFPVIDLYEDSYSKDNVSYNNYYHNSVDPNPAGLIPVFGMILGAYVLFIAAIVLAIILAILGIVNIALFAIFLANYSKYQDKEALYLKEHANELTESN